MSDSKVKVGQRFEWTGSASGGLYTVVSVRNAIAMLTDSDGHRGVMDTKQPAPQWKRVQDAPEAKGPYPKPTCYCRGRFPQWSFHSPKKCMKTTPSMVWFDESGPLPEGLLAPEAKPSQAEACAEEPWKAAFRDAMKPWKRGDTETPWFAECATAPFQQSECCWCDGPHASVACPERYPVVDWYNAVYLCGGELQPIKKAFPEAAPFQEDACSARRGTLPKSERAIEPNATVYSMADYAAPKLAAEADLRRKVGTMRSWPTCPVSGEAYRIEARVSEEFHDSPPCGSETLRTWQASFCCPTCSRGGK